MSDLTWKPGPAMLALHEHVANQAAAEIERSERESRRTELLREAATVLREVGDETNDISYHDLASRIRKELGDA